MSFKAHVACVAPWRAGPATGQGLDSRRYWTLPPKKRSVGERRSLQVPSVNCDRGPVKSPNHFVCLEKRTIKIYLLRSGKIVLFRY